MQSLRLFSLGAAIAAAACGSSKGQEGATGDRGGSTTSSTSSTTGSASSSGTGGGPPHVVAPCAVGGDAGTAGVWENITPPDVGTTDAIALDPFVAGTLWLGTDPTGGKKGGVFKSTDCGATWTHVNTGANGDAVDTAHIWSMAVDYAEHGVIYVIGQYGPEGLWKSTDGGVSWT